MSHWSQIEIAGKSADVFEPTTPNDNGWCLIHLHGHGMERMVEKTAFLEQYEKHGLRVICPHGKRSWWLDFVCKEFDAKMTPFVFLRNYVVPFMMERWNVTTSQIGLTGISMGGQGVLHFAYRSPSEFPVVAAISPAVDFHNLYGQGLPIDEMFPDKEAARQATVLLHVNPLNWPKHQLIVCDPADVEWFESSDRMKMKLSSSGIPCEYDLETSAGGHTWDYFSAMAEKVVGFAVDGLQKAKR